MQISVDMRTKRYDLFFHISSRLSLKNYMLVGGSTHPTVGFYSEGYKSNDFDDQEAREFGIVTWILSYYYF